METVARLKEMMDQRDNDKLSVTNKFMPKLDYMKKQRDEAMDDQKRIQLVDSNVQQESDIEIGYFAELDATFKASGEDIKHNYLKKMQELLGDRDILSLKNDKYILKEL